MLPHLSDLGTAGSLHSGEMRKAPQLEVLLYQQITSDSIIYSQNIHLLFFTTFREGFLLTAPCPDVVFCLGISEYVRVGRNWKVLKCGWRWALSHAVFVLLSSNAMAVIMRHSHSITAQKLWSPPSQHRKCGVGMRDSAGCSRMQCRLSQHHI